MNDLRRHSEDYLSLRRALGYKLVGEGQLLVGFVTFCERAGVSRLNTEVAVAWTTPWPARPPTWRERMRWHVASPATSIRSTRHRGAPAELSQPASTARFPYIYAKDDVLSLMAAARTSSRP